jgi:hypothetical protein
MAQGDKGRVELNLKASICTDNPTGTDIYKPGDPAAKHVENTGIERQGGLTPIYEQETTFATAGADSIITKDGSLLQVDASGNVRLDDAVIGSVGLWSVYRRAAIPAKWNDAVLTATGTILVLFGSSLTDFVISELNPATMAVVNTRTLTFAGLPARPWLSISFVRYVDMAYADAQEILIQTTGTAYRIRETGLTVTSLALANGCNFMHRFGAGKYITGIQGNRCISAGLNTWNIGDIGAWTALTVVYFVTIDRHVGTAYSRAICTFYPNKQAVTNIFAGLAWAGYTAAGGWTPTLTYCGANIAAATITSSAFMTVGPGYSESINTRSDEGAWEKCYIAPDQDSIASYYLYANATQK